MSDLVITNGDSAADRLRAAGCKAGILPWRDVLHDGPVLEIGSVRIERHSRTG
ncbi:MAG: hypothetical protein ACR2QJ_17380 [Geminicoccaceae bacterium]